MSQRTRIIPCAVPGCSRLIEPHSRTGVCRKHMHYTGVCTCYQCSDPVGIDKHAARAAESMQALNRDPTIRRTRAYLSALSAEQRELHRFYTRTKKLSSAESMALIKIAIARNQTQGK